MDKYIFNENNSLWYDLVGDYYFPCLTVPTEEEQSVSVGAAAQVVSQRLPTSSLRCLAVERQTEQLPCRY